MNQVSPVQSTSRMSVAFPGHGPGPRPQDDDKEKSDNMDLSGGQIQYKETLFRQTAIVLSTM